MLTVPAVLLGILLMTSAQGMPGLLASLEGVGLALGVWIVTGLLGGSLGGGDIKLLAAVGALSGPLFLLHVIVFGVLAGGVWAVVAALRHGLLRASLRRLWAGVWCAAATRTPGQLVEQSGGLQIPYAPAIALGTVVALLRGGSI